MSAKSALMLLENTLTEKKIIELNAKVEVDGSSFSQVARSFLSEQHLISNSKATNSSSGFLWVLLKRTQRHLFLTVMGLALAIIVGVPLGILLIRYPRSAQFMIGLSGLLQTIPSIALLALFIPILGIGIKPAIGALFLYSLLPILRNTYVALSNIDVHLLETAKGIGLYPSEILRLVRLPLGAPVILAGIRTAAVISIGTATLAAFIGAGGLGDPIVTGLALSDTGLLLEGALPAAALAILAEFSFGLLEKRLS